MLGLLVGGMLAWSNSGAAGAGAEAIAGGLSHSCALQGGAVSCWGDNTYGQLGDGTNNSGLTPVAAAVVTSGVTAIATGLNHSCAIQGGAAYCWGSNSNGQLGNGTNTDSNVPVAVTGLGSGVTSISAGGSATATSDGHTCAVQSGSVVCWGYNASGQLGDGTTTDSSTPVSTGITSAVAAATGRDFSCALKSDGSVLCWGQNANGRLGDGTTSGRTSPVAVTGLGSGSGVTAITAGYNHACALQSGAAVCWGSDGSGQLGDGGNTDSSVPVAVFGPLTGVTAIAGGGAQGVQRQVSGEPAHCDRFDVLRVKTVQHARE